MKALTKISIGFLALAAVALWFTSCSSEDVAQNGGGLNEKDQRVLLLSVNTGNLGTRSTTALTADEKQINDMTVGIYDKTGNYRVVAKLASSTADKEASGSTDGTFTTTSGVKVQVVTSTLQKDDQVLVAVNRGTAAFTSKPNSPTDFSNVTMDATTALQFKASSTDIDATKFPKFGTATLPAGSNSTFTTTVNVKNLVSKVTLEDLKVDFSGPYANASFTPSDIFLLNVPNKLAFSATGQASTSTPSFAYLNGTNIDKSGGTAGTKTAVLAKTITGAPALSSASGGTASYAAQPILYTIPNSDTSNKTILVIAGKFKKDASATAEETVYYPLALNEDYLSNPSGTAADGGTKSQTLAGKNYKCKVVIKTIGASNPWVTTGPQTAVLTVSVDDWEDAAQTTTFE